MANPLIENLTGISLGGLIIVKDKSTGAIKLTYHLSETLSSEDIHDISIKLAMLSRDLLLSRVDYGKDKS